MIQLTLIIPISFNEQQGIQILIKRTHKFSDDIVQKDVIPADLEGFSGLQGLGEKGF